VRLETLEVPVPRLPEQLRGLRIAHLSDFHLGVRGRGRKASERAVEWAVEREPDLVVVSGDLLSTPRGEARPQRLADPDADLRILVCHFPRVVDALPIGAFQLVLAGHMHGGQICLPYPGGRLGLAHPRAPYTVGLYLRPAATLHVSPGLGTTFVPFRFFSRPEATELVLEPA